MSNAELAAYRLYNTMHLASVSEEVKRHLIILMLSNPSDEAEMEDNADAIKIPQSYEEALQMGAVELTCAREELHAYANKLSKEYNLQ